MSFIQKLFTAVMPKGLMEKMKLDSQDWMMRCPCGHETSVWDLGGIRYKAASSAGKRTMIKCRKCGERTWHRYYRKSEGQPPV
jgi:formylmethanofuran dehydrogenase subunit E